MIWWCDQSPKRRASLWKIDFLPWLWHYAWHFGWLSLCFCKKTVMINSCRHRDGSGSASTCCNCADIVTMANGSTDDHKHLETPTYNRSFRWGSFLLAVSWMWSLFCRCRRTEWNHTDWYCLCKKCTWSHRRKQSGHHSWWKEGTDTYFQCRLCGFHKSWNRWKDIGWKKTIRERKKYDCDIEGRWCINTFWWKAYSRYRFLKRHCRNNSVQKNTFGISRSSVA